MRLALQYWKGQTMAAGNSLAPCEGQVEALEPSESISDTVRVHGWLYDPQRQNAPSLILFSGKEKGIGVALGGFMRPDDASDAISPNAKAASFVGYLQKAALDDQGTVTLTGWANQQPACVLTLNLGAQAVPVIK
jgi:hypothetical protein